MKTPPSACGAVVTTFRVAVALEPLTDTEFTLRVQVMNAVVEHCVEERFTVPLKPFIAVTVIVEAPDCPGEERLTGVEPTAKSAVDEKFGQFLTRRFASTDPRPVA